MYVLKSVKTGKFIAVDSSTGGYPYEVDDLWRARIWEDPIAAIRYTAVMSWQDYENPVFYMQQVRYMLDEAHMPKGEELEAVRNSKR
jgi:hypothetical protein